MPVAEKEKKKIVVRQFEVEADTRNNGDLLIQSIPGCRLRGALSASKSIIDSKTGEPKIPQDAARHLGQLPPIPGMRLLVTPAECSYRITDPLFDDEDLCERIRLSMEQSSPFRVGSKLRGVPPQKGFLDVHRTKTLCRELLWNVESGDMKVTRGMAPELREVEQLPGEFLLNPGSQVHNSQPTYEKDWDEWVAQLTRSGG